MADSDYFFISQGISRRVRMRDFVMKFADITTKVTRWLVIFASVCIGIVMVVNSIDVIGTKFFGQSIPGALDITEELMVFMTLLPLAYVALERGHIRVTLLDARMNSRKTFIISIFQYSLAAIISAILASRTFLHFLKTVKVMTLKEGIDLPIWPANLVVVVSFFFLTIVWLVLLARTIAQGVEEDP
jgi:TRAP-type C4-dicarboxylate transport system permease small subunit